MIKNIDNILIDFLKNIENKNRILVLKGKWGVGKTYFWNNFFETNKKTIADSIPAYSYVSLFGIQNSLELKEKVTRNLISLTGKYNQLIKESTKTNVGGILTAISKIGYLKRQIGDLSGFLQDALIRNQLICFDDIERIDSRFPIETLMGYVDELAQQKNCKIILIFNEDELEENQKNAFDKYREKIVDIELTYSPTLDEQLRIVFGDKLIKYPIINKIINGQESVNIIIKNIRVLKKINQILDDFIKVTPDSLDVLIMDDFIKRAIYLSYCFYEKNNKVPFEIIKNPSCIAEYTTLAPHITFDGRKEIEEEKAKQHEKNKFKGVYDQGLYDDLMLKAQRLYIHESSVFTEEIIHKLEHGLWSEENLKNFISSEIRRIDFITKQSEIRNRLERAWHLYRSSFQDNLIDIIDIFEKELENPSNYSYWDYGHFIHTLDSYYDFKKLEDSQFLAPVDYIDDYIRKNAEQLRQMTWVDHQYINLNTTSINPSIKDYAMQKINEIKSQKSKISLSEFVRNLKSDGLSNEQSIYIQNLTLLEIKDWLQDLDDPLMSKYINNLRSWSAYVKNGAGINNPNADTLINQALKELTSQNNLNKYRIDHLIKSKE